MKTRRKPITTVLFSYTGTDAQFDQFLKAVVNDYCKVDHPGLPSEKPIVGSVESGAA